MNFTVMFVSENSEELEAKGRKLGTDDVEKIREYLEDPEFPVEMIAGEVEAISQKVTMEISYEKAKASGCFQVNSVKKVTISDNNIERLVDEEIRVKTTGGIIDSVLIERSFNPDKIYLDWEDKGFPDRIDRLIIEVFNVEDIPF